MAQKKKQKAGTKQARAAARAVARKEAEREVRVVARRLGNKALRADARYLRPSHIRYLSYLFDPTARVPGVPDITTVVPTARSFRKDIGTVTSDASGNVDFALCPTLRQMINVTTGVVQWGTHVAGDAGQTGSLYGELKNVATAFRLVGAVLVIRPITGSNGATGHMVMACVPPDPTSSAIPSTLDSLSRYADAQVLTAAELWSRGAAQHAWLPINANRLTYGGSPHIYNPTNFISFDDAYDAFDVPSVRLIGQGFPASTAIFQLEVRYGVEAIPTTSLLSTYPANTDVAASQVTAMALASPQLISNMQARSSALAVQAPVSSAGFPQAAPRLNTSNLLRNVMNSVPGFINTLGQYAPQMFSAISDAAGARPALGPATRALPAIAPARYAPLIIEDVTELEMAEGALALLD